jgi:TolA-binding protein
MTEQAPNPAQPTESTLALSFLREGIQDLRQDVRQIHERIDQTNGRIDDLRTETNERINDLAKQLDSRYARLMAMLIACTSILVTTMGAAVAVLK